MNNEFLVNPSPSQLSSPLNMVRGIGPVYVFPLLLMLLFMGCVMMLQVYAGCSKGALMIDVGANQVNESLLSEAIALAQNEILVSFSLFCCVLC